MTIRFPYGYQGAWLTWDEMMRRRTVYRLHNEVLWRLEPMLYDAQADGVSVGVGTGWRVQPLNKPGFAKPGNSYHEEIPTPSDVDTALAIDTVGPVGNHNRAWDWLEENCAIYGFRTFRFVNNEPWHIQPVEIPTSRNRVQSVPKLKHWDLPGEPVPPPVEDEDVAVPQVIFHQPGESAYYICMSDLTKRPLPSVHAVGHFNGLRAFSSLPAIKIQEVSKDDPMTWESTGPVVGNPKELNPNADQWGLVR